MDVKKSKKKHHILLSLIAAPFAVAALFCLLRVTHVILRVGEHYTTCFNTKFSVMSNQYDIGFEVINDTNISEIVYMKNLRVFNSLQTDITNVDFISNFTKLETFSLTCDPAHPECMIRNIPSLGNSPDLDYVFLYSAIKDLDFLADSEHLKYLTVVAYESGLTDISGLKNKPDLKTIYLQNVKCSDFSVLLDLPSLKGVILEGTLLPDDIKNGLAKNGVSIDNYAEDHVCMLQGSFTKLSLPYDYQSPKSLSLTNTTIGYDITKSDEKYIMKDSGFLSDLDTVAELCIYVDSIEDVSGVCEMDSLQTFRVNKGSLSDEDKDMLKDKGVEVIEE